MIKAYQLLTYPNKLPVLFIDLMTGMWHLVTWWHIKVWAHFGIMAAGLGVLGNKCISTRYSSLVEIRICMTHIYAATVPKNEYIFISLRLTLGEKLHFDSLYFAFTNNHLQSINGCNNRWFKDSKYIYIYIYIYRLVKERVLPLDAVYFWVTPVSFD